MKTVVFDPYYWLTEDEKWILYEIARLEKIGKKSRTFTVNDLGRKKKCRNINILKVLESLRDNHGIVSNVDPPRKKWMVVPNKRVIEHGVHDWVALNELRKFGITRLQQR